MNPGIILKDKYKVLKKIQDGGQSSIFLAILEDKDLSFAKEVVVKYYDKDNEGKIEFISEVKFLSHLTHPNIAKILDVGLYEEKPYIVLEYIEGLNLKELREKLFTKRMEVPIGDILTILEKTLDALVFAHSFKDGAILHRDISPSNIIISADGFVKLIDFGISGVSTDQLVGKPNYLPQKVLTKEEPYSIKTELYSLAVTIYELATLRKVRSSDEVDFGDIKNKKLREFLKDLYSGAVDENHLLKKIRKICADYESNLSELIKKSSDDMYLVDGTVKITPAKKQTNNKAKFLKLIVIPLLLLVSGLAYFLLAESKYSYMFTVVTINTDGDHYAHSPPKSFSSEEEDKPRMSDISCDMFCYQGMFNLVFGHIESYEKMRKMGSLSNEHNSRDVFLNHSLDLYKRTQDGLKNGFKYCAPTKTCDLALRTSNYLGKILSPSLSAKELRSEYVKLMNGTDKELNGIAAAINNGGGIPEKSLPITNKLDSTPGVDFAIVFTEPTTSISKELCREIGDFYFLTNDFFDQKLFNKEIYRDFPLMILNRKPLVNFNLNINSFPVLVFENETDLSKVELCSYLRSNDKLKYVQTWNLK